MKGDVGGRGREGVGGRKRNKLGKWDEETSSGSCKTDQNGYFICNFSCKVIDKE